MNGGYFLIIFRALSTVKGMMIIMGRKPNSIQRDNILTKAFPLFKEKGYDNTSTREIAAAANIERGLLHYYYNKKEYILFELYSQYVSQLVNFILEEKKMALDNLTCIATFDILFFKVVASKPYLHNMLKDILSNRNLAKLKIEKTMVIYEKLFYYYEGKANKEQLFIATAVAVGAEVELVLNKMEGKFNFTYDELGETIVKLEFLMLKIDDVISKEVIEKANQIVDKINLAEFEEFFKRNCKWYQD